MKDRSLSAIIDFFALISNNAQLSGPQLMANLVEVYLSVQFSKQSTEIYMTKFTQKAKEYADIRLKNEKKWDTFFYSEIEAQCYIITREVQASDRLLVLIYLMELSPYMTGATLRTNENATTPVPFFNKLADLLHFSETDFADCLSFVNETFSQIKGENQVLVVTDNKYLEIPEVKIEYHLHLRGQMIFLKINSVNTILYKVNGESRFEVNGHQIYKRRTNVLSKGALIQVDNYSTIYFNDIEKSLSTTMKSDPTVVLQARGIEYKFPNGKIGIHELGFSVKSGELMAIMGGSGSGKTTLMNVLIGFLKPTKGNVVLNNLDIHRHPNLVKGYIGYVPQDDALINDLTAYQNLFYNANLCLGHLDKEELTNKVDDLLKELGLYEIRNLKVGSPLEKVISGGQRKRLNIAMELIRDPKILFLDEPTSGLSSSDSENIMQLLKTSTFQGKLIIINIHQPSSDIFKLFDQLLFIDQDGYPVYFGRAAHVMSFLKKAMRYVDAHENECHTCGNLNPDDIFHFVQMRKIDQNGQEMPDRVFTPVRWHRSFLRLWYNYDTNEAMKKPLPHLNLNLPSYLKQFWTFNIRNLLTKLADRQYLAMSLLLPPLLALVLSVFSRHVDPTLWGQYVYGRNDNIPHFLLMSVIVALFVGMISSSEEIIKDRMVLKRESFLRLSFGAYVMAKILFLVTLSGIQMWSYLKISGIILQLPYYGMKLFPILWATACFANVLGLLMSSLFKSAAAVYVSIPFLLIPQILLSGGVINFEKINPAFSSPKYVPAVADAMVAKWSYEALTVDLFMENDYTALFYGTDKELNELAYLRNFLIPEIENVYYGHFTDQPVVATDLNTNKLLMNGLVQLWESKYLVSLGKFDPKTTGTGFADYIDNCRTILSNHYDKAQSIKDSLLSTFGSSMIDSIRMRNTNTKLSDLVTGSETFRKITIVDEQFVRKMSPIYYTSPHEIARSHIYAPTKNIAHRQLPTKWFNVGVISLFSLCLLAILIGSRNMQRSLRERSWSPHPAKKRKPVH
ncbi:MAG: ATP-binding cassette domain-containing protein [Breznakibacter sp.]